MTHCEDREPLVMVGHGWPSVSEVSCLSKELSVRLALAKGKEGALGLAGSIGTRANTATYATRNAVLFDSCKLICI